MNFQIEIVSNGFLVTVEKPRTMWFALDRSVEHAQCYNPRKVVCRNYDEIRELMNSVLTEFEGKHKPDPKKS